MEKSMCRVCLSKNIRLKSVVDTDLQYMYEKLTDYMLVTEARPLVICYICCARLKNCLQLMIMSRQSEEILTLMETDEQNYFGNKSSFNTLCMKSAFVISIGDGHKSDYVVGALNVNRDVKNVKIKKEVVNDLYQDADMKVEIEVSPREVTVQPPPDPKDMPQNWSGPELLTVRRTEEYCEPNTNPGSKKRAQKSKPPLSNKKFAKNRPDQSIKEKSGVNTLSRTPALHVVSEVSTIAQVKQEPVHEESDEDKKVELLPPLEVDVKVEHVDTDEGAQVAQTSKPHSSTKKTAENRCNVDVKTASEQPSKMLIFFENGTEILISFTLTSATCTLEDILRQNNIEFTDESHIQCLHNKDSEIEYAVAIGKLTRIEELIANHPLIVGNKAKSGTKKRK